MKNAQGQRMTDATVYQMGADVAKAVDMLPADQARVVIDQVRAQGSYLAELGIDKAWHDGFMDTTNGLADQRQAQQQPAVRPVSCPCCSGSGVLTDDPQILRCEGCGGIFTDPESPITTAQAAKFVALHLPMAANAGPDGQFYFDLDIYVEPRTMVGDYRRFHGWADKRTKRVVQWG